MTTKDVKASSKPEAKPDKEVSAPAPAPAEKTDAAPVEQPASEDVIKKGSESASERSLVRRVQSARASASVKAAEDAGLVVLERGTHIGAEKAGERLIERGVEWVSEMQLDRAVSSHLHGSLKVIRVLVVILGSALVAHMAHHDWHRFKHEWQAKRYHTAGLFYLATVCDLTDLIVHFMLLGSLTFVHIDHHTIHEAEDIGFYCALCSIASVILGELLSPNDHGHGDAHGASHGEKPKEGEKLKEH